MSTEKFFAFMIFKITGLGRVKQSKICGVPLILSMTFFFSKRLVSLFFTLGVPLRKRSANSYVTSVSCKLVLRMNQTIEGSLEWPSTHKNHLFKVTIKKIP